MNFAEYQALKENFNLITSDIDTDYVEETIQEVLSMVPVIQKWHNLTDSYALHETLEELYNSLKEYGDKLAEYWIGIGGRLNSEYSFTMTNVTDKNQIKNELMDFRTQVMQAKIETDKSNNLLSVSDSFHEILEAIDMAGYKLGFE